MHNLCRKQVEIEMLASLQQQIIFKYIFKIVNFGQSFATNLLFCVFLQSPVGSYGMAVSTVESSGSSPRPKE
jgi:hypothetical protein